MPRGIVKRCLFGGFAGLLLALSACTTLPFPRSPPAASPATPVVRPPVKPEPAGTTADAAPPAAVPADDKYKLTGDAARELERGQASWYGPRFHGRRTASGERLDMYALTAAHKTLPFGTLVRVRSVMTGREVDVRINDRGPFTKGRVIAVALQAQTNPARNLRAASIAKTHQLRRAGNRHDARHNRHIDAKLSNVINKAEIGVCGEKILGNGRIGPSPDLGGKRLQVGIG